MTQPTSILPPAADTGWAPPGWAPPTAPAPPAPPAKRKVGRWIVGGIVLLFIVASVAGSGDKKDASTTSDGVVATTATTAPTAAASTSAMSVWATRYGSDDADMLKSDLTALSADADALDVSGMSTSCRTFQRHLATAASHLPTPDAQLTSSLTKAYGYFTQAMTACISGIANLDPDELGQVATYLGLGSAQIKAATARINLRS